MSNIVIERVILWAKERKRKAKGMLSLEPLLLQL